MKAFIHQTIDQNADTFKQIATFIAEHPELGNEEYLASAKLIEALESFGFTVTPRLLGLETAFLGVYETEKPGPVVAFLCEYDALPDLGHACGHHLICTMSLAAAVGLKAVINEVGGSIRVYGTPAEETKGAKVPMAKAGLFDDVSFAMMAHPYYQFEQSGSSLAMDALQFEFRGKAAHAAASPHQGVNALDAVLLLFQSIGMLRQQLESHVRIHGIITEGGKAANIIPDYAAAQFYVRAATRPQTNEVVTKVKLCAEGAALQTGCRLTVSNYEYSYDDLVTNQTLSNLFNTNLFEMGVPREELHGSLDHGSLDLGNVSRRCPSIHPFMKIIDQRFQLHTPEFRDLAMQDQALDAMLFTGKVLASTAYDVLCDPAKLLAIREEFERAAAR